MATLTQLIFNNNEYQQRDVHSFAMAFNQPIDAMGQVTGVPRGGQITLRLKALDDSKTGGQLYTWMIEKGNYKSGHIEFKDHKNNKVKDIEFKQALCVNYIEYWEDQQSVIKKEGDSSEPIAHWEEITISCLEIKNSIGGTFKSNWDLEEDSVDYFDNLIKNG